MPKSYAEIFTMAGRPGLRNATSEGLTCASTINWSAYGTMLMICWPGWITPPTVVTLMSLIVPLTGATTVVRLQHVGAAHEVFLRLRQFQLEARQFVVGIGLILVAALHDLRLQVIGAAFHAQ